MEIEHLNCGNGFFVYSDDFIIVFSPKQVFYHLSGDYTPMRRILIFDFFDKCIQYGDVY